MKGVTIVKPIVYGNVARYFGKKREEDGHTHQWTVYVKPYRNEVSGGGCRAQRGAQREGVSTEGAADFWVCAFIFLLVLEVGV